MITALKKEDSPFFDAWESAEASTREKFIRDRLNQYVSYAREFVDYYRDRLSAYDAKAEFPLEKIDVLQSSEIRDLLPPLSRKLFARQTNAFSVFQSGGTTGFPKTSIFTHEELEGINLGNGRGFYACGLNSNDRVANLWAVGGLYMTFIHMNRMLQQYGCMSFPFSNHTAPDFVRATTDKFEINCFTGIASVVLHTLREISKIEGPPILIDKIYYGGEHLYESDRAELREKFGTKTILAPGYGSVDTWYIGYQCSSCPIGVFHAHDDQAYIEIVDEETKKHTHPNEIGMLYVTAFLRKLTPIVRYRVGDRARWLKDSCSCGRTTPLFELLGRGDDVLRIGYDSIDYQSIQSLLLSRSEFSGGLQLEKKRREGRDVLVVRVETPQLELSRELKSHLECSILESRPSLREFIQKGSVLPIEIEILPMGSIPQNPRTGKLIRVVDLI